MTIEQTRDVAARLTETAAETARRTPGVAFLRPGFAELVHRSGARSGGVRVRWRSDPARWEVELHFAVAAGHRALDVTHAVRTAVTAAATATLPGPVPAVSVTTTVTELA
jgi:hypothetical protein